RDCFFARDYFWNLLLLLQRSGSVVPGIAEIYRQASHGSSALPPASGGPSGHPAGAGAGCSKRATGAGLDRPADPRLGLSKRSFPGRVIRAIPGVFHVDMAAACSLGDGHAVSDGEPAHRIRDPGPDFGNDSQFYGG